MSMRADRFRRIRDLFEDAIARDPAAREAFLAEQCAGDPDLLSELKDLLAAHREDQTWLDRRSADVKTPLPGETFGPYQLIATLGAGMMGQVYRARDSKLNRDV